MTPEELEKLRERSITKLDTNAALKHIGVLIDTSQDARFGRGADRAIYLLTELAKREINPKQGALIEYFCANAWSVKEEVSGNHNSWAWEQPEREQQILALSRAATHPGFDELHPIRRCQILTNRANQLNAIGRFVDAIESWDAAIGIMPRFAMAQANRGYGLKSYGGMLDDNYERAIFLLHAHDGLVAANAPGTIYDSNYPEEILQTITSTAAACARAGDLEQIRAIEASDSEPRGRSKAEREYRQWCLEKRLFLNPLNDIGAHSEAAWDSLVLPSISEKFNERPGVFTPPPIIGFFNQMKQEFVSARYLMYQGTCDTRTHFSDRRVQLFDTLDYPRHGLATELIRTAFRVAYSLFDKIAFFINHYWKLGKIQDRINFRNVWMIEGKQQIANVFKTYENWPLRGLYWLSKELFDDKLKNTTGPDARELHDIRNALEHKYLQVHADWAASFMRTQPSSHGLGISISSDLLEAKALRVMKMGRAALIQLALAIGIEERARGRAKPDAIFASMALVSLDDNRKRRDIL